MALASTLGWIVEDPRAVYAELLDSSRRLTAAPLVFLGALLSVVTGDALLVPDMAGSLPLACLSYLVGFVLTVSLFFLMSGWFGARSASWLTWLQSGVTALLPVYLLLPLALLARPLGPAGFASYEVAKLLLALTVVQRTRLAIQTLNRWPAWAAGLVLIGPLLLSFVMMMVVILVGILLLGVSLWPNP